MGKKLSIALVLSSIIIGGTLIFGSINISNSIEYAGNNITNANFHMANSINGNGNGTSENYELVVIDGWLYLYNSMSGQIWKKADNDNLDETWQVVKHIGE
ncbi:hypothetical protein JOC25_000056 [Solibacillus kalamii]|uniref:Uncharacterized protein n=1 Tax=Solibacillus kalamii TaxID=1748298 RepID=A0ABX3ZI78_9BACL|nr:hypothetical protein [Solibacillus kalamii]MBM7663600.1 hypothetical protein [Solibacillus kalamii]OUZ39140.1 hypothetical protein CBM15_09770 [Solibacillus kalamii]